MRKYQNILFLLILIMLYLFVDYQHILFLKPQGIHFIRQTDSLSFAANYFKNGFNFFHPQVFNLSSFQGRAACEFPILYFITANIYRLAGEHSYILRLITLLISSIGFFFMFKLISKLVNDLVYALGFTFLFISSTVLLYYSNNFLPDASALGLTLVGMYLFFRLINDSQNKCLIFACFSLFAIASLIKVTYIIYPITAFLSLIILGFIRQKNAVKILKENVFTTIAFIILLIFVVSWNLYAIHYNRINNDYYFLVQTRPIWSMSSNEISITWDHITNYWYSRYYSKVTLALFYIMITLGLLFSKKSLTILLIPTLVAAAGGFCYFIFFFAQFKSHDYYFLTLLPAIILLVINSFIALKNRFPKLFDVHISKAILIVFCLLSLVYAREKLALRYSEKDLNISIIGDKLSDTKQYIDSLGIASSAKFVIINDVTPNGGLYFINRSGWNLRDTSAESMSLFKSYVEQGADYVLFTDRELICRDFDGKFIGIHNGILLYEVDKSRVIQKN